MTNSYKVSFDDLRHEGLKEVFAALERAMSALDIDFYLIGAMARDTWFAQNRIRALGTKDVDFAVLVSDSEKYSQLKKHLVEHENFVEASQNEFCLIDKAGTEVDLLPFGAMEIESMKMLDSNGVARTDVTGFKEIYEGAVEEVNFDDSYKFKVSTLEGIVILKLIAYHDRPEIRNDDIRDIAAIITHYFDLESDQIYDKHNDLFTEEEDSLLKIASRVLGRQMQLTLNRNEMLKKRIISILEENTKAPESSEIGKLMTAGKIENIETAIALLNEIKNGITEERYNSN